MKKRKKRNVQTEGDKRKADTVREKNERRKEWKGAKEIKKEEGMRRKVSKALNCWDFFRNCKYTMILSRFLLL